MHLLLLLLLLLKCMLTAECYPATLIEHSSPCMKTSVSQWPWCCQCTHRLTEMWRNNAYWFPCAYMCLCIQLCGSSFKGSFIRSNSTLNSSSQAIGYVCSGCLFFTCAHIHAHPQSNVSNVCKPMCPCDAGLIIHSVAMMTSWLQGVPDSQAFHGRSPSTFSLKAMLPMFSID